MSDISVFIYEPIYPGWTADSTAVTADSTIYTADGGPLVGATDSIDAIVVAAGAAIIAEAASAADVLDAEVVPAFVEVGGGFVRPFKPFPVVGVGYGILPQLEGEAFGAVGAVGHAAGTLRHIRGAADGTVGIAGRSAGELVAIRAAANGKIGAAGRADAVFKNLSVAAEGAIAAQGSGAGVIAKFQASASGRHDDDAAAVMAFLLAA